jgi:hypothetical protein
MSIPESDRERQNLGEGIERHYQVWGGGGSEITGAVWEVPRHRPLVLLIV